jgi:hypothetical protein
MRRAKIEASEALARRSVAVIGNEIEAEDTGKGSKNEAVQRNQTLLTVFKG